MRFWSDKGQGLPWKLILTLITGLAGLLILLGAIGVMAAFFTPDFFSQSGCWMSNTLECGGGVLSGALPDFCQLEVIEHAVDAEELAELIRNTWYQYKQGQCDFGLRGVEVYPTYAFVAANNTNLGDFFSYIMSNNRGVPVDDVIYSDYNYLESGTDRQSICFDKKTITDYTLEANDDPYYISYYDDRIWYTEGSPDVILISKDPSFDGQATARLIDEYLFSAILTADSYADTMVPIYISPFEDKGFSPVATASEFAQDPGITIIADPDRGCILYGPPQPQEWHNPEFPAIT